MQIDSAALLETLANARRLLLAERRPNGCWEGELSASALSTATALFALHLLGRPEHRGLVTAGLDWLSRTQNADGGWGDTVLSFSNVSTTALCWSALSAAGPWRCQKEIEQAEGWLKHAAGDLSPASLARTIIGRYGKDRTFSVPILTMLALAGRLGEDRSAWRSVLQLPFELAACPHHWFQWVRLPVVSYALPALIAIGQVRHHFRPTWNPFTRLARELTRARTLALLKEIQPASGGFLEATPLTSFVTMSLIAAGQRDHPVVASGVRFLEASARPDGCWPIDTNLATWVTTLSVNALAGKDGSAADKMPEPDRLAIRAWLLRQQYRVEHPYTHAAPGGWAWTDLSGGVPDADDTPGALLALARLGAADEPTLAAARAGLTWLLDLQNTDGGMPTFCRGWGALPFDRSSADLTAHSLLAWTAWRDRAGAMLCKRIHTAVDRALRFLRKTQRPDGSWAPLWFGNQHANEVHNLTYGTSRVARLAGVVDGGRQDGAWQASLRRAAGWLVAAQNADGGWGGRPGTPSSIEETALAIEGLAGQPNAGPAIARGIAWLAEHTDRGRRFPPAPIGFYFANLWYYEKLYPLIFTVAALSRVSESG